MDRKHRLAVEHADDRAETSYRGHRRDSFIPLDEVETIELRARYRTFHGAYTRTALLNLGFAAVILKIFDKRFYAIGLLYAVLSLSILAVAFTRSTRSDRDFSDGAALGIRWDGPVSLEGDEDAVRSAPGSRAHSRRPSGSSPTPGGRSTPRIGNSKDPGPEPQPPRRYGRAFRTSGFEVVIVSGLVLATQAALLGLLISL